MQVAIEERAPGRFVVSLDGELDIATAPLLTDAVVRLLAGATVEELVIDLAGLRFLDSSGVQALMQARRAASERGAAFAARRPDEFVARILRIMAVDRLLGIAPPPTTAP